MSTSGLGMTCGLREQGDFPGPARRPRRNLLLDSVQKSELSQDICVLLAALKASNKEPALLNYLIREEKTSRGRNIDRVYKLCPDLTSFT